MTTITEQQRRELEKQGYKFKYIQMLNGKESFYRRYKYNKELDLVIVRH